MSDAEQAPRPRQRPTRQSEDRASAPGRAPLHRSAMPPVACAIVVGVAVSWNLTNVGAAADSLAAHFGVTLAGVGLLTSALFVTQFFLQVPVGRVVDRFGVRPVGLASLAICVGANALILTAPAFAVVAACRGLCGAAMAMGFIAGSTWARASTARTAAQGMFGASAILGGGLALATVPALVEVLGWWAPFATATAVGAVGVILLAVFSQPPPRMATKRPRVWSVLLDRKVLRFAAVNIATFGSSIVLGNWIVPYLLRHGSYTPASAGAIGSLILIGAMAGRLLGGIVVRGEPARTRLLVMGSMIGGTAATAALGVFAAVPVVAAVTVLMIGLSAGLPFAAVFNSAANARPDAPAVAIAAASAPAVAWVFIATPLVGATFAGSTTGRAGVLAVAVAWGLATLLVPTTPAFAAGAPSGSTAYSGPTAAEERAAR